MRVRKNWLAMTTPEREMYLRAVLTLKRDIANPGALPADQYSVYDMFVLIHQALQNGETPYSPATGVDLGHQGFHFLPWHRKFLLEYENALNSAVPGQNIAIPYWDWTDYTGLMGEVLVDAAFGPNGSGLARRVSSGYFALTAPSPVPMWWPTGLMGWSCRYNAALGTALVRNFATTSAIATQAVVRDLILQPGYLTEPTPGNFSGLWLELEGVPHADGHNWFTDLSQVPFSHMTHMYASPNDPMFFLHHSQVDRIWAMWQRDDHEGISNYETGFMLPSGYGHLASHALFPWFGTATGWTSPTAASTPDFPDFSSQPATTIADMLDHRALGYAYDTEPVVGLALDRTGSMTGVTPDPVTGMPSTMTKWEVASEGIANFLQDCEAARDAGEAVVTAGVETFRRTAGTNEFDKVLTPDFAVVRTGSTSARAAFEGAMVGISPAGGTPIAGALLDTETTLVRVPYTGNPAGETRYLSILTDGKETAGPYLNTITAGQLSNTIIFAMGFGEGSGWDGVDYTMIQTITEKGKTAPVGVDQVFHGENAGAVNKFYTNSVAAAIGYTPISDPVTELAAGEQTSVPFSAGPAERSYLIVIQGFDGDAKAWSWGLLGPDDSRYDLANPGPLLLTEKRNGGRITLFVHRNGMDDAHWNGTWLMLVGYHARALRTDIKVLRMARDRMDLLLPSGVGMPLEGPRFANARKPRPEAPFISTAMVMPRLKLSRVGVPESDGQDEEPPARSTVAVDVYARTAMPSALEGVASPAYAGGKIEWVLHLDTLNRRKFGDTHIVARVVRPGYQIGKAYLDQKTIPLDKREAFVDAKTARFDEVKFLAAYEEKHPHAFPLIREDIVFEEVDNGVFTAVTSDTRFPGTYRVAVVATSEAGLPGQSAQPTLRVLNAQAGLGIRLDEKRSGATWHWRGPNNAAIVMTPLDRLGNIPSPAGMPTPVVEINGKAVKSEHINDYSGRHVLMVTFDAGKGAFLDSTGRSLTRKGVHVAGLEAGKVALSPDAPLQVTVRIGSHTLSVELPERVVRVGTQVALPAGHKEVLKWKIEERIVFRTTLDAKVSGFLIDDED